MKQVKNANGKLVCQVDVTKKTVEIVHKGLKNIVRIMANGSVEVLNSKTAA